MINIDLKAIEFVENKIKTINNHKNVAFSCYRYGIEDLSKIKDNYKIYYYYVKVYRIRKDEIKKIISYVLSIDNEEYQTHTHFEDRILETKEDYEDMISGCQINLDDFFNVSIENDTDYKEIIKEPDCSRKKGKIKFTPKLLKKLKRKYANLIE